MLCRVHWLLWNLSSDFKGKYVLRFDYSFHNYLFYRFNPHSWKIGQVFQVIRTSKKCFRLMYYNDGIFRYYSFKTSKQCAEKMIELDLARERENLIKGVPP